MASVPFCPFNMNLLQFLEKYAYINYIILCTAKNLYFIKICVFMDRAYFHLIFKYYIGMKAKSNVTATFLVDYNHCN